MISNYLPEMVRCACDAGNLELAERILRDAKPRFPYAAHALVGGRARVAEARGEFQDALAGYRDAATRWTDFSMPLEEGHARLGEARCLIALGRQDEAQAPLSQSRAIFERLGAEAPLELVATIEAKAVVSPAAPR